MRSCACVYGRMCVSEELHAWLCVCIMLVKKTNPPLVKAGYGPASVRLTCMQLLKLHPTQLNKNTYIYRSASHLTEHGYCLQKAELG